MPSDSRQLRLHLTRSSWHTATTPSGTLHVLAPDVPLRELERALSHSPSARAALEALAKRGAYAAISHSAHSDPVLHTDINRSFPLYWQYTSDGLEVADDHRLLGDSADLVPDAQSVAEFANAAFTVGTRTLRIGVHSAPADAEVTLGTDHARTTSLGRVALPGRGAITDPVEAASHFEDALHRTLDDLVRAHPNSHFVVPLSGGTDSRLIAAMLRDIGPRRLTAFTYGIKGSIEAETSRLVAAALDIPWQTVTLSPRRIHAAWSAEGTGSFLAYSHLGNALPHVQDWFAIRELSRAGVIGEDSVVLPGHTAARSYIPLPVGPDPGEVGSDKIIDAVILRHFNQRGHFPLATPYRDLFSDRIREELQLSDSAKDPLDAARLIQTFNIQHRQTKYILNSVRTYEHFGAGWSMPLLSAQCHRAMQDIDWSVQSTKGWYRRLTDSVVRRVAGATLDDLRLAAEHPDHLPVPAPGAVSSGVTAARRSFVRASRQLGNLRHPMAFEAFSRTPSAYLSGLARRQSPVGIFAHQFLQGTWNKSYSWRDPATWDLPRATRTVQIALPNPRE